MPQSEKDTVWTEIQVEVGEDVAELLAATLSELCDGVEIRDADTLLGAPKGFVILVVQADPQKAPDVLAAIDDTLTLARAAGASIDTPIIRQRVSHESEWRDVWKQFFHTTRIGKRVYVCPSWDRASRPPEEGNIIIDLDPGRAFGTGAHPTTRLVVGQCEMLADAKHVVNRFLDLGCGSGILSIAAARLWPESKGMAADIDDEAVACTRENFADNDITSVQSETASLAELRSRDPEPFDLLLANIEAPVLIPLAGEIFDSIAPCGRAILSGILNEQADSVIAAYRQVGFELTDHAVDGEWSALSVLRR